MDANSQYELSLIKKELQSIIDELYNISRGVERDFSGIGNDKCAVSISAAAKQYETVKKKLDQMDLSAVTEEFAAKKRAEAEAKARAEAEAKAKAAAAKAKAEAEAKAAAKAKAEAEAKAKAAAEAAKKQSSKSSSKSNSKSSSKKKKDSNILEDILEWLF